MKGYSATPVTEGQSGGVVWRLQKADCPEMFLKAGRDQVANDIVAEMARIRWLSAFAPGPEVVQFVATHNEAWLLTSALPGVSAYEYLLSANAAGRRAAVAAIARFLRVLHALPAVGCPFNSDHNVRLAEAWRNLQAGVVDESDFGQGRQGWTAQQVWARMQSLLPFAAEAVVTHGDFSLGNILIADDGKVSGCIDFGRLGTADRYQDLSILWDNLEEFGSKLQQFFLKSYGVDCVDSRRLEFHLCLDEFF